MRYLTISVPAVLVQSAGVLFRIRGSWLPVEPLSTRHDWRDGTVPEHRFLERYPRPGQGRLPVLGPRCPQLLQSLHGLKRWLSVAILVLSRQ